jgi:hypothetical protein
MVRISSGDIGYPEFFRGLSKSLQANAGQYFYHSINRVVAAMETQSVCFLGYEVR